MKSDVDLLVIFGEAESDNLFEKYFGLRERLEGLLKRPVEILFDKKFKNPCYDSIEEKLIWSAIKDHLPKLKKEIIRTVVFRRISDEKKFILIITILLWELYGALLGKQVLALKNL